MEIDGKNIPPEIIDEILLKLPIKSLLGFSSISKSWNSCIFSPWFIKKYRGRKILVCTSRTAKKELALTLSNDLNQTEDDATTLIYPISEKPILLASCDTLLCIRVGVRNFSLFLWNPWMRTYRKLCKPPSFPYSIHGLGYDAVADDYKMLSMNSDQLELHSLRSDSWRKIQLPQVDLLRFRHRKCVFVNGAFHWIVLRAIISFDLSTEKFEEVTGPKYSPPRQCFLGLAASKGKLCVCVHYHRPNPNRYVMWTMEVYGVAQSWTKTFEISFDDGPIRAVMDRYYRLKYLHSYDVGF